MLGNNITLSVNVPVSTV